MPYTIDAPSAEDLRSLAKEIIGTAKSQEYQVYMQQPAETRSGALDAKDAIYNSDKYDWIIEAFEQFLSPSPWDFEDKMDTVRKLASRLGFAIDDSDFTTGEVGDLFDTVKNKIAGGWDGDLADALVDNYLAPMSTSIPQNQGRCLLILHDGMQAMCEVYSQSRRNLKELGNDAITALEAADGSALADVKTLLTVLDTMFALGSVALSAAYPAASTSVDIAGVLVSAGMAELEGKLDDPEEVDAKLASLYPDEVMDKVKAAIDRLEDELAKAEEKLIDSLTESAGDITGTANKGAEYNYVMTPYGGGRAIMDGPPKQGSPITPMIPDLVGAKGSELDAELYQTNDS